METFAGSNQESTCLRRGQRSGRCTPGSAGDCNSNNALTLRAVVVGVLISVLVCFSNVYFGLQAGITIHYPCHQYY
jgi:OPT oligopeptide transporter protein